MLLCLRKYWLELMVFGAVFGVLIICNLPAMSWVNTDSDGPHYILSAKYLGVAHNTSAPLFLLLGRLFLFLPFGTEAWRMGLISVLATTGCAVLIYKVVRYRLVGRLVSNPKARMYALIASLTYGGSALVISQSTIIETYALSTMLAVGAYYCCLRHKWLSASVLLGLILAIHPLFFVMTWLVLFVAYRELRIIKLTFVTFGFLVFYLYIPLSKVIGGTPEMWGNTSLFGFLRNNFGTMWMLAGGLAMLDLPKRILDTLGILGVSLGLGIVVVAWYYIKLKKIKNALLWLILIPTIYFLGNLAPETYVYLLPAVAFGAIVVGIGLSQLPDISSGIFYIGEVWYEDWLKWLIVSELVAFALFLLAFNANYFDIGRTLDPNLSAQKFYDEELPKIKDGEIYLGGGWTWAIVYLYNIEEGRNIVPVCIDILPSEEYLGLLEAKGINLVRTDSERHIDKQWEVAQSIARNNPNVWISKETIPSQYEYKVVPAKGNEWLMTRWLGYEKPLEMAWKPSNPYDFITGAIEVSEWKFILKSTHNCRFMLAWGVFGYFVFWLFTRFYRKKGKN